MLGFGASLLILVISSVASYISITNLLSSARLVNSTNEVITEMHNVLEGLLNAETGQRGFLLAKEDEFLEPYVNSRKEVMQSFQRLQSLTSKTSNHNENLARLNGLIERRFEYLDLSVNAVKSGTPVSEDNLRRGREIMTDVRETIDVMETGETLLLAERTEAMNKFAAFTPPLIVLAALLAITITILFSQEYTVARAATLASTANGSKSPRNGRPTL